MSLGCAWRRPVTPFDITPHRFPRKTIRKAAEFFDSSLAERYIFGINIYTDALLDHFDVRALVINSPAVAEYRGLPILDPKDVPANSLVVVASGGRTTSASRKLNSMGLRTIDYFALRSLIPTPLPEAVFNEGFRLHFANNENKFLEVMHLLADENSKNVFRNVVNFRLTGDLNYVQALNPVPQMQYRDLNLRQVPGHEHFVDVGAYDGSDSLNFLSDYPGCVRVDMVEPSSENAERCRAMASSDSRIRLHQVAVTAFDGTRYLTNAEDRSRLSSVGEEVVITTTLDNLLGGTNPTFMKFDIEGEELDAVRGSSVTISESKPSLALAAYHKPADFWRLPQLALELCPDYEIRLRHYGETLYETIMYFTLPS